MSDDIGGQRTQIHSSVPDNGRISLGHPIRMSADQLKSRLYATSEIHTNAAPQLRMARRRSKTTDVS